MATNYPTLISSKVISNLDTYTYTVQSAALHYASLTINEIPPSGISITIKQNGSTIATSPANTTPQQVVQLAATMNCAVNDVISIVVASGTFADSLPNVFKGTLTIKIGSLN